MLRGLLENASLSDVGVSSAKNDPVCEVTFLERDNDELCTDMLGVLGVHPSVYLLEVRTWAHTELKQRRNQQQHDG